MNLILLFKEDFVEGSDRVCLRGRRQDHVLNVHRAAVGDELCVGLCGGKIGTGRVVGIDKNVLEMDVHLHRGAPLKLPVTLVLALPRPAMLKRVLASASSMGVKEIILFHSYRVEKSFWKSPVLDANNIKEQLILGLEQARDTVLPEVKQFTLFKPFVEDKLPAIAQGTLTLVAHPQAERPCPGNITNPVTLVIGPEGGFIPYELETLVANRFTPVHLGKRILRVETAVPAILSKLFY